MPHESLQRSVHKPPTPSKAPTGCKNERKMVITVTKLHIKISHNPQVNTRRHFPPSPREIKDHILYLCHQPALLLFICCKSFPLPPSPSPSSLHLVAHRQCSPSCMWTPTHCTHWRRWSRRTLVCTSLSEFPTDLGDCWLLVSIEAVKFCFRLDIISSDFPVRTLSVSKIGDRMSGLFGSSCTCLGRDRCS